MQEMYPTSLYNKLEGNNSLCNKKTLFSNLVKYYQSIGEDPHKTLPLTFHITEGTNDKTFTDFRKYYESNIIDGVNV